MNILVAASTMQVFTTDKSKEKPSLSLKVARVVGNICVSSLDLLCVARLIPCPSQRHVSYNLTESKGNITKPENETSDNVVERVENHQNALNVEDHQNDVISEHECRRKDFYSTTNYTEEEKIDNIKEDIINNVEDAVQQKPTTSKSIYSLQNEDLHIMEEDRHFHKFMLDVLYRNDAFVEIMTPPEFKEYCKNLFKQQTGT